MSETQQPQQANVAMEGDPQFSATLQNDGKVHKSRDELAWLCLVFGVVTLVLATAEAWDVSAVWHAIGVLVGVAGFCMATYAQLVSATTRERWLIVPGWVLAGTFGMLNFYFWIG